MLPVNVCFSTDLKQNLTKHVALGGIVNSPKSLWQKTPSKSGEIRDTKTLNLSRNIVSLQVLVDVSRFSPCVINLLRKQNICCRLKKVVAKSRARVYFVQQILALLPVFHQTHNLARNNFARVLANQPIRALHFFDQQQMFLLRITLIMQAEKRDTSTKTCNDTMLRDKLRVFVSRISPP